MSEVVVVGGGLAGLVAARGLAEAGDSVTLLERRDEMGGRVRSETVDGFTLDRGFQVLFTAYPAVRRELDLDALDLGAFRPGATVARGDNRSSVADPLGDPWGLPATLFSDALTLWDAWRLLGLRRELARTPADELLVPAGTTTREYLRENGFSRRFLDRFAAPFYGGITLDRSLSTSSAVFRYTFKMLASGRIAIPADGMGAIPAQLARGARDAGATIDPGTTVQAVDPVDGGDDGVAVETGNETLVADAAIVATDPASARELTGLAEVPTDSLGCLTQHFALPRTQDLHVRHPLVLNADEHGPNQVAIVSDASPSLAPEGQQLISATYLGQPSADEDALADRVREHLAGWFPENRFEALDLLRTHRIEHAQHPQPPGFLDARPAVDAPDGPVYLAGDYTRWASIQGALESGRRAVGAIESA
ncbi:MAG: NAD(P)/FAD-dependent oxidoreductase [Haloarculaceae archaeon]